MDGYIRTGCGYGERCGRTAGPGGEGDVGLYTEGRRRVPLFILARSTEHRAQGEGEGGGTGTPDTSKISCGKCVGNLNDTNMEKNGRLGQKYELPCHLKTFGNRRRASSGA